MLDYDYDMMSDCDKCDDCRDKSDRRDQVFYMLEDLIEILYDEKQDFQVDRIDELLMDMYTTLDCHDSRFKLPNGFPKIQRKITGKVDSYFDQATKQIKLHAGV